MGANADNQAADKLHQLNRTLKAHTRSMQALVLATDEAAYLLEVCKIIVDDCGHAMVWVGFKEEDEDKTVRPVAWAGFEDGYLHTLKVTWDDTERGRGPTGTAIRTGRVCACRNMRTDPLFLPWREQALKRGYASSIVTPLLEGGKVFGALTIYSKEPDPFSESEVQLLTDLARDFAHGISVLRLREAHAVAAQSLRESEERYRSLVEMSPDAVLVNHDDRVVQVNAAALRLLRAESPDRILGRSPFEIFHPDCHDLVRDRVRRVLAGETVSPMEEKIVRLDGTVCEVEAVGSRCREKHGFAVQAILRDITERKAAEERLRESQKLESIGLLAGGIAHDFNNLLVGVIGSASLAQDMVPSGSPVANILEGIVKTGEQLAHLTRQMLAYSGKGRFYLERLDLSELIAGAIPLVSPSIPGKIEVRLELDRGLPPIEGDRGQIQQILTNFVINASEAIGGEIGLITIKTGRRQVDGRGYAYVEVRDTGCGMDEATRARIFDPFFSTKFVGRGLGLAAVGGIVRGHKGSITVASAPGEGSCFTVLLPVLEDAVPVSVPASQLRLAGRGTILVVDDEELVRQVVQATLVRYGYEVLLAASGLAAIDVFKRHPGDIALVILDQSMHGLGGEETLPQLRKIRPNVRVVVSSGYSETEMMRLFAGQRVSGFLQKPYTASRIAEAVKTALSQAARAGA